ncbi:tetratricopeptide repeat protein [Streptomyces abikoensis]|uniref:Tetratricopeptide repeat protein n=1 Tax=Streptomyces abikoensis TaxID=97398 RepID=A0ABW7T4E6_9ACTN
MNDALHSADARGELARAIRTAMDDIAKEGARKPTQAQIAKFTQGTRLRAVSTTAISAWRNGKRVPDSWATLDSFLTALEKAASLPRGRFDRDWWSRLYERSRVEQVPASAETTVSLRVRDADPLELMVHRARTSDDGNAVPDYVPRDVDPAVRNALSRAGEHGGVILLIGDSTAGKTRCAYEALIAALPDHLLVVPRRTTDVSEVVAAVARFAASGERCVLWLNDMERYLGPGGLDLHGVRTLRAAKATVLGTMRTRFRRDLPADELVGVAEEFEVNRLWSPAEIRRAQEQLRSNRDPRLRLALDHSDDFGIAETLATGPQLWRLLRGVSVVNGNPRGAALVWTAIDLALAGLTGPLPLDLLKELHEDYIPGRNKQLIAPEPLDTALTWATTPPDAVTRLLIPEENGLRPFDYLLDAHLRERKPSPELIPERIWESVLSSGTERHQRFSIAIAAHANSRMDIGRRALRPLADAQDSEGMRALGVLCESDDRDEAARWLQLAAEAGDVLSLRLMGNLHLRRQDHDSANEWYRRAAEAGDELSESYYNGPGIVPAPTSQTSATKASASELTPGQPVEDHEDWDDDEEWEPTPRTLRVLKAAFDMLADTAFDVLEEIGDARVDLRGNYTEVFSDMPVLTWGQNAEWRRRMARCFDDLADDIRKDRWPLPNCTGEEMAMHLALQHASAMVADDPDLVASLVKELPEDPEDYDWSFCMAMFLEDTDVLFLYEPWSEGIEDPDHQVNQFMGIANLGADDWFDPFYKDRARDPERGFRR